MGVAKVIELANSFAFHLRKPRAEMSSNPTGRYYAFHKLTYIRRELLRKFPELSQRGPYLNVLSVKQHGQNGLRRTRIVDHLLREKLQYIGIRAGQMSE